jgi:site-specific DNA recombinase
MRAVLYKRVSTSIQVIEGVSLETQEEKLIAYCTLHGWEIVKVYEDAGLSGKDTNRPAFQQMIKDAENKKFDVIVVYKLDRLTRSVKDFHELAERLDVYNVSLVSVTQNLDTSTPVGRLLRNILVDFANFEREMIRERTMDSKYSLAEKGQWLGGKSPFGYKVENKKLILVPDEAQIVKNIYDDYIRGSSVRKLMVKYNLKMSLIMVVLANPIYTGLIGYSKTEQTKKGYKQRKNINEWILAQGDHEAIITKELWDRVQEIKKENFSNPGTREQVQLFENMCYCACGKKMYYYTNRSETYDYRYYRCNSSNKLDKGCGYSIREDALENRVIPKLLKIVSSEKFWVEAEKKLNSTNKNDYEVELKRLEKELAKVTKQISNMIFQMGSEGAKEIAHLIAPEIKKLETRKKDIQLAYNKKKEENLQIINLQSVKILLREILNDWHRMDLAQKRQSAKLLIKKMIITDEKIILTTTEPLLPDIIC